MKHASFPTMKLTAALLAVALMTPFALAFGLSAAAVSAAATGIGLAAIAVSDYATPPTDYTRAARVHRSPERLPLAA